MIICQMPERASGLTIASGGSSKDRYHGKLAFVITAKLDQGDLLPGRCCKVGICMGSYYCVQILQLKPTASSNEFEALMRVRVVEMERWIPGVLTFSLLRAHARGDEETIHYFMTLTFTNAEAYAYWHQVEDEASTYWPQLASTLQRCEQLSTLINEYEGTMITQEILNSDR